jgi:hypothetical protein
VDVQLQRCQLEGNVDELFCVCACDVKKKRASGVSACEGFGAADRVGWAREMSALRGVRVWMRMCV